MATSSRTKPALVTSDTAPATETAAPAAPAQSPQTGGPVDLDSIASALEQFAQEQRPMLRRGDLARQRIAQKIQEAEAALNEIDGRTQLLDRIYEAARRSLAEQRADITEELTLYLEGINGHHGGSA